jgi:hypothetical protein
MTAKRYRMTTRTQAPPRACAPFSLSLSLPPSFPPSRSLCLCLSLPLPLSLFAPGPQILRPNPSVWLLGERLEALCARPQKAATRVCFELFMSSDLRLYVSVWAAGRAGSRGLGWGVGVGVGVWCVCVGGCCAGASSTTRRRRAASTSSPPPASSACRRAARRRPPHAPLLSRFEGWAESDGFLTWVLDRRVAWHVVVVVVCVCGGGQTPDGVGQLREWAECYKQVRPDTTWDALARMHARTRTHAR